MFADLITIGLEGHHTFDSAHRTARDIRVSRIHAMWRRACRNFTEAHFAYELASKLEDQSPRRSPEAIRAGVIARRALQRMTHWNKRSAALALAEIKTALAPIPGGLDVC